ncbi:hypothetical protein BGX28_006571 [Mortierella sp. GBA30]|nr:hypothetical protein BGX28_006571 [Mortierella sp. GBA30]
MPSIGQEEFLIRNTKLEELDEYINVLERAAEWMESQNLAQWIPGTFRKPDSRLHITNAIVDKNSYVVFHTPTETIAAIFALNYEDPFDEMLWVPLLGPDHWKDAIYVHRLVVEKAFQGRGIAPKVLRFVEELVPQKGKTYLRLDCRGNNPGLRKFYREKCRGLVADEADGVEKVMGLGDEKGTYTNPATGINYARFERLIVILIRSVGFSSRDIPPLGLTITHCIAVELEMAGEEIRIPSQLDTVRDYTIVDMDVIGEEDKTLRMKQHPARLSDEDDLEAGKTLQEQTN